MDTVTLLTENFEHQCKVTQHGAILLVSSRYHPELSDALKAFDRSRWLPEPKCWSFPATFRNLWSLRAMEADGPMDRYFKPSKPWTEPAPRFNRRIGKAVPYRAKQRLMIADILHRRQNLLCAEPRTGKTLAYMTVMELVKDKGEQWFVAPVKVLDAIRIEMEDWGAQCSPILMSYDEFRKRVAALKEGKGTVPYLVIYDEGSKLKGHSQRTKAAIELAALMDREHGEDCIRVLGTGTPQPKDELDWFFLCESVRPGFIPIGNIHKFTEWMQVRKKSTGMYGNDFWAFVQWKNGAACIECNGTGKLAPKLPCEFCGGNGSVVDHLTTLKSWLTLISTVVRKSEVMELPDKEFVILDKRVKPAYAAPQSMLNVAKVITEQGGTAIQILEKLSQLADGFQYVNDPVTGKLLKTLRGKTPKDLMLKDLLVKHEEVGRFVVFTAYQESTAKCADLAAADGWKVLRCDGKGWKTWDGRPSKDALYEFMNGVRDDSNKICFVGHPGSGGYGLNLASSPGFFWYSLGFNGEHWMQGMERGHSAEMDFVRGCTLYLPDVLPTDKIRRDNLTGKVKAQDVTLDDIQGCFKGAEWRSNPETESTLTSSTGKKAA